jgi:putative ABC transport system permease protein
MMAGVGIALGIGMTLLGISGGQHDLLTGDFTRSGANLYVVTEGGTLIPVLPSDTPGTIKHGRQTLAQIRRWPEVSAALGVMNWSLEREREGPRRADQPAELVATLGVDGDPTAISNALALTQGRWVQRTDELVVGPRLSREKQLAVGDPLRLSGRTFTVVGVGKLRGLGFGVSADAVVYMDYAAFRQRAELGDVFNMIAVQARQPDVVRQRIAELGALSVFSPDDLVRKAEEVNSTAVGLRWVLIGLTMSIAALFVSNMLARSVAERRLEFATLRAIGIPTRTILLTVAVEALLISVAAGAVGIVLSQGLGWLINATVAPAYGIESLYSVNAALFGMVFVLALGLGLVAGLFPARQATRVDPVDVLREA